MDGQYVRVDSSFSKTERRSIGRLDSCCHDADMLREALPWFAPQRLLCLLVISIFLTEVFIMLLLAHMDSVPVFYEALIDSATLLIILSPTFYFFHYRPIMIHYRDRKGIVERLCRSEERLNLALSAVNDGLWDWNLLSGEVYASIRASAILGLQPDELGDTIRNWEERLHPDDRESVKRLLEEHLRGETDYYRAEHRLRNKADDYIWVLARGKVVARGLDNQPLRFIATYTDISARKQAEEALRRSEADIRRLSQMLMQHSEEEKNHLAQDLHDEFGQVLCTFRLGVEMLKDRGPEVKDSGYRKECHRLIKLVDRLEVDLRHMCDHLRPVMLDDLGLIPALKWHLEQFAEQNPDVSTSFNGGHLKLVLSQEKEIALYRVCQETLNNVAKYAQADRVDITLRAVDGALELTISDNGDGFQAEEVRLRPGGCGMGLLGMRERIAAIGGQMLINSTRGQGTQIKVLLPLKLTGEILFEEVYE